MRKKELQITQEGNQLAPQKLNEVVDNRIADISSLNSLDVQQQNFFQEEINILGGKKNGYYNKKYLQKKSGIYQPTKLEQAKETLKNNKLDIAELKKQQIWGELQPDEINKLNQFLANEKKKLKKPQLGNQISPITLESKLIITEEQQNIISNVQVSRNELISKELCASQTFENQVSVMLKQNHQNHLAIFDFLKSLQQEPFEKFFEVLIEVIQAVENFTQQVRLLIGLFGIYNGQKLNPKSDLCCLALKYLAKEDGVTSQQVIGFLKFTFVTNGDLHNAELSDLVQFDRRHKQCFIGFKQWLQWTFHLPPDLTLVLPNSCYVLGLPFARRLQNESEVLTEHIPSEFLALFIQTLAFSFEKDEQPFLDFLNVAKNGFLDLIEKIKTTQLLNLFSGLLEQVRLHNRQWYLNIRNSKRLIEGAFFLVKENKVRIFDKEVCQNLLSEVTNVDQYLAAPSFIKSDANQENEVKFKTFLQLNQQSKGVQKFLQDFDFGLSLPLRVIDTFSALKINPHFIQELAMKIICQQNSTYSFLNIAPGLGKTKLILAVGINLIQTTDFPVFILNPSKTLCNRDFQEAVIPLEELKIACASVISQKAKITFSTTKDFVDQKDNLPKNYHVLLDEYQNIFFIEDLLLEFVEIVRCSESFIGFSGSPLNPIQKKLLRHSFEKLALVLQLTPHTDLGEQETVICKTQAILVKKLAEIADKYRYDTPQVFILDPPTATALIKGKKSQRYEYLIDKQPALVNNMLIDLFNKPNDKGEYGTYIIDEEMGTGTDFKTSSDIESKGGLVLVFGVKPTNTSTFEQLSCRVGRIFNKSRRFYIIQDAAYTGSNRDYLKYQLKMLRQQECEEARALLSKIKLKKNGSNIENDNAGESSEDVEIEDGTPSQNSHNKNTSDENKSHLENEKLNSMCMESDESFDGKSSMIQTNPIQKAKSSKKRARKDQDNLNLQQRSQQPHNKNIEEECKICGDTHIQPYICPSNQINTKTNIQYVQGGGGDTSLCSNEMPLDANILSQGNSKLQSVKTGSVSESNKDFQMKDETPNLLKHVQNDEDGPFDQERFKIESKNAHRKQSNEIQNDSKVKKRLQKEQDKIISKESKLFQHKKKVEECKFCGDAYIVPHFCQQDKLNIQSEVNASTIIQSKYVDATKLHPEETALDPDIFLKGNDHFGLDQTPTDQSGTFDRKGSKAAFQNNYLSENVEEFLPKFDNQLQKRNKDTKKIELLEQQVMKSLQDPEEQYDKVAANLQKAQKELVDYAILRQRKISSIDTKEEQKKSKKSTRVKAKQAIDYDDLYFKSYEAGEIHEEMLDDEVRMNAYQQSINNTCKDQIVIDVGAGTGILSIFAAEGGASHVYGIEYTNVIEKAKDKVSQSNFAAQITLVRGKAEDVDLGQIKVDVIVSEWMGYFLLFENMLPSVLSIRDRYLKEKGTMLPKRTSIHLAVMNKKCENVAKCSRIATIDQCEQEFLVSTDHQIFTFDLEIDKMYTQKGFESTFELVMLQDCAMTGFVAWFDAAMTDNIMLSTSPKHPLTHWKQTLFYLPKGIEVQKDTKIAGKVIVGHQKENPRALWFTISYKAPGMKQSKSVSCSMN